MTNPYFFTDEKLELGFKKNLNSHKIYQANSNLSNIPGSLDSGIEMRYFYKTLKQMATVYARLINQ